MLSPNFESLSSFSTTFPIDNVMACPADPKPDYAEVLIDDLIVIWFHDDDLASDIQRAMEVKLNQSFKYPKTFVDKRVFMDCLNNKFDDTIMQFIISGKHAEELGNLIFTKLKEDNIYELDITISQTIRKNSNTWFTFGTIDELFKKIIFKNLKRRRDIVDKNEDKSDEKECEYWSFLPPLSTFSSSSIPHSFHSLDKDSSTFLWFQLLSKTIIQMKYEEKELETMCAFCRKKYWDKSRQTKDIDSFQKDIDSFQKDIDSFQRDYSSDKAIEYYTGYIFLFKSLTEVFQRENTIGICKFRPYIADLHKQLEKKRCTWSDEEIILYRGKKIPLIVLQQLNDLDKQIDKENKFVSMNGFLSTTKDENVAEMFAGIGGERTGYESAIFKLKINKAMISKICCADITCLSSKRDEKEVLFSVKSIWKLLKMKYSNDRWMIELELTDEFDRHLTELDNKLWNEYSSLRESLDDYYNILLAKILYKLGRYSQAEERYNCLLEKQDLSPDLKRLIHLNLATMQDERGQVSEALKHFKEAFGMYESETISLQPNHAVTTKPSQMIILNVMGLLYHKKEDYGKARDLFKDALEKPGTSIEKAIVYNNLGISEMFRGSITSEVHEYLEKAVELSTNSVWSTKFKQDLENVERWLKKKK